MQKKRFAGTCRQCAAAALLAAVAACTEDMPAEAPAVVESPQPAKKVANTAAQAVAGNVSHNTRNTRGAHDAFPETGAAGTVAAALHNIRQGTDPALLESSEETEFGQSVLAYLDLAAPPEELEGAPPSQFAATDRVRAGQLDRSGLTGAADTNQILSAEWHADARMQHDPNALSDEQDFTAVSSRETIESDAARRRQQIANRKVFAPADLPEEQGEANVALYALSTSHNVGSQIYDRHGTFFARLTSNDKCAEFSDDFEAQQTFLDAGGPLEDELRIDPDGDGFACSWTPDIYRSMLN